MVENKVSKVEQKVIIMPSKEGFGHWANSKTAKKVYQTMHAIDEARHGFYFSLNILYGKDKKLQKIEEWEEQQMRLAELMPIKDFRHAVYMPSNDTFITFLHDPLLELEVHVDDVREELKKFIGGKGNKTISYEDYIVGTVATVKENDWKIFDLIYTVNSSVAAKNSVKGLRKRGYVLVDHSWTNSKDKSGEWAAFEGKLVQVSGKRS